MCTVVYLVDTINMHDTANREIPGCLLNTLKINIIPTIFCTYEYVIPQ